MEKKEYVNNPVLCLWAVCCTKLSKGEIMTLQRPWA